MPASPGMQMSALACQCLGSEEELRHWTEPMQNLDVLHAVSAQLSAQPGFHLKSTCLSLPCSRSQLLDLILFLFIYFFFPSHKAVQFVAVPRRAT